MKNCIILIVFLLSTIVSFSVFAQTNFVKYQENPVFVIGSVPPSAERFADFDLIS